MGFLHTALKADSMENGPSVAHVIGVASQPSPIPPVCLYKSREAPKVTLPLGSPVIGKYNSGAS